MNSMFFGESRNETGTLKKCIIARLFRGAECAHFVPA